MKASQGRDSLQRQYQHLQEELAQVGLIALGTITPRRIVRRNPQNRRRKKIYGPYYQWTYKLSGKTVTVNLTEVQAGEYQRAINNQRKLEGIVKKMLDLSRMILESTTVGVVRRVRARDSNNP